MNQIVLKKGELRPEEQQKIANGFEAHSKQQFAPKYRKERLNWVVYSQGGVLVGVVTADILWDWMYLDELWVDSAIRNRGLGKKLIFQAEQYARENSMKGLWLWTQSWQAPAFYTRLGFEEFTRFPDFPAGYERIGFRKLL